MDGDNATSMSQSYHNTAPDSHIGPSRHQSQVKISIYLDFRYIVIYIEIMRHKHIFGFGRHFSPHDEMSVRPHGGRHHKHGRGGRLFDYGELRLLILALIAEAPSHGYELIKSIEERFGGSYTPSPGVIYPTLSWLDDMGYAVIEPE